MRCHADDEVIGCGALIAAAAAEGMRPRVIFITDGSRSHPNSQAFAAPRLAETRRQEAICAAAILGVDLNDVQFLDLPDTQAPHDGAAFVDVVARLQMIIAPIGSVVILAPWSADPHCDHLATHNMATVLAVAVGARHLSYPVWGWTLGREQPIEALPAAGWRLPVGAFNEQRKSALAAHRSQVSDLIDDDPTGFRLDARSLAKMCIDREHFEKLYAANPDPWNFNTSEYEAAKYAATLEALPRPRFHHGLEVGCSFGVLSRALAQRVPALAWTSHPTSTFARQSFRTNGPREHST
eukprot:gene1476-1499_t